MTGESVTDGGTSRDPLVIRELRFLGGMASVDGWRPEHDLPEVAFVGRSNVGKSSLLNRLVRRRAFARVSRTPGRTREINFFAVNEQFALVDLPGYGYARVSKTQKQEWRPLMEKYLASTRQLRGVVMLLDVRREPTDDDHAMLEFLAAHELPTLIAVTKIDKLAPSRVDAELERIAGDLELDADQLVGFSAVTGKGRDELAAAIASLLEQPAWREG
ncbi:MAG TPA: ribosome biogenesis GTP-binding protein YihA/YsxC [Gemmatimonadales bacterium]|nr:ribosome biogenesis GTP-binding protein YihA/YsxC [Gemmatimonadales bacterium]